MSNYDKCYNGSYRILYTVETETVSIHALRHGARRPLLPEELHEIVRKRSLPGDKS